MKNTEIERKFLVREENLPDLSKMGYSEIVQGYIQNIGGNYIYRLRQCLHFSNIGFIGDQYFQTIKGKGSMVREEFEIELLKPQFTQIWPLCKNMSVTKKRYEIVLPDQKCHGYLDVYKNNLKGLYTIEVEFETEDECRAFIPPSWFGIEVTEDFRYTNYKLAAEGMPVEFRDELMYGEDYNRFVDYLASKYDCVCRGGQNKKHWSSQGATEKDVVVFERGIKGPADWFYLNKEGRFAHGGYTGYAETFDFKEFEEMIIKTQKHNDEWEKK